MKKSSGRILTKMVRSILRELSTVHQDFTESDVCNEARALSKSREKFAEQANNQFAFANTISLTSGSVEQKEAA